MNRIGMNHRWDPVIVSVEGENTQLFVENHIHMAQQQGSGKLALCEQWQHPADACMQPSECGRETSQYQAQQRSMNRRNIFFRV